MRLCGFGNGGDRQAQNGHVLTLEEIASQLGTSKRDLQRALYIERNLTDSMKELMDTGVITKTLAADTISSLAEEDLIETNIRQRGIGNHNLAKLGRCIKELERIYGIREGSHNEKGNNRICQSNNFTEKTPKTEDELLKSLGLGLTRQTLQNYKKLTEMIPELEELVDTGVVTNTTALAIMKNLSDSDQLKLISLLNTTKKITKREVQQYIDRIKQL